MSLSHAGYIDRDQAVDAVMSALGSSKRRECERIADAVLALREKPTCTQCGGPGVMTWREVCGSCNRIDQRLDSAQHALYRAAKVGNAERIESPLRRLDEFYEGDAYPKPEQQRSAMVKQLDVDPAKVDDIVKQLGGSA